MMTFGFPALVFPRTAPRLDPCGAAVPLTSNFSSTVIPSAQQIAGYAQLLIFNQLFS
jgi:hypothetical protein